jgi:hypothetical protein
MKINLIFPGLMAGLIALAGCASAPRKEKAVSERGWIGADFQKAGRDLRPQSERAFVYVRQVFPHTPAAQAGLQVGDLVLSLDNEPIAKLSAFCTQAEKVELGRTVKLGILRSGQAIELPVTVGRERYQQWNDLRLGLGFSTRFDVWPNPDYSLLPVTSYKRHRERLDWNSPESILKRNARESSNKPVRGMHSEEGWDWWFVLFGFGQHKTILAQEQVEPLAAGR